MKTYTTRIIAALVKSEQIVLYLTGHDSGMDRKQLEKLSLTVSCPTCGAAPGQKCELNTGQPRTAAHRDRRLSAADEHSKTKC